MSYVELTALPSRTPLDPRRSALRPDPYWSGLWRGGSSGDWYSAADYRGLEKDGFVKAPTWLDMGHEEATARMLSDKLRDKVLSVLGVLDQWRTVSVHQLEAMTGITGTTAGSTPLISVMWNAGLIEICELGAMFRRGDAGRDALLLRPCRPGDAWKKLQATLSFPEWVSVHAGFDMDADRQFARHNILATEFGLRVAEFCNVGMVLGEKLSTMSLLAYSGVGAKVPTSGAAGSSDLTLVRPDGLRIAVEMTASISGGGATFTRKVEKIAALLSRRPLRETGLCVLFVAAPRRDATPAERAELVKKVRTSVHKAVLAYPGTATDPTAARIGVVSWTDLFPDDTHVHNQFAFLPCHRPTGGGSDEATLWEPTRLLDAGMVPFAPARPKAMTAVIGNASGLRGVPYALRRKAGRPPLNNLSMQQFGFKKILHVAGTRSPAAGRGASGARTLPPRLTF